ncbi:MAG: sulfatase-like hydrolase/transferase [Planctomycetota bacterium]
MSIFSRLSILALCSIIFVSIAIAGDKGPPNVLIIYGDDQGSIDLNCFGASDLLTPELDALAAGGIRLTRMYAPSSVCSASRAGLLTGRFPLRAGQPGNGPMPSGQLTIAEIFREAGYRTAHVGKWHLGSDNERDPIGQGFQSSFGHLGGCIDNYSHFFFWSGPNRHDLFENRHEIYLPGSYFPDLMVDRCKSVIDAGKKDARPWLLYWAFNAPHYPYQGTPEWLSRYSELKTPRREYAAFLSTMDESIGKVLRHLKESGQANNTIVVYQPDHGHSTETRAFGGGGKTGGLRGAKFSLFEGGIRVPSIVSYPGKLRRGTTHSGFCTACDWLPTLASWCGVELPNVRLDGVSIADDLVGQSNGRPEQFFWQMGKGQDAQWAVRDGPWKLIVHPRDTTLPQEQQVNGGSLTSKYFLSNLRSDPGETTNLADSNPQRLKTLLLLRDELLAE